MKIGFDNMLTSEAIVVLISNIVVALVLLTFFILNTIKLTKKLNLVQLTPTLFFFVYFGFLTFQSSHLIYYHITTQPFGELFYVIFCFSCQTIISLIIWNLWGVYFAGKVKYIPLILSIVYLVVIGVLFGLYLPFTATLDPTTLLYDMDIQAPINYLHYTSLVIDVIALVYIFVAGLLNKEKEVKLEQILVSIGFIVFISALILRALGMGLALTISRKVLMCLGALLLYWAFSPPKFMLKERKESSEIPP